MPLANDMTLLINKIENRLGLKLLTSHLPEELNKDSWGNIIKTDTMVSFSRYFPRKVRFVVNDETCVKRFVNNKYEYIIKDEYLNGVTLLGATKILLLIIHLYHKLQVLVGDMATILLIMEDWKIHMNHLLICRWLLI